MEDDPMILCLLPLPEACCHPCKIFLLTTWQEYMKPYRSSQELQHSRDGCNCLVDIPAFNLVP